MPGLHIRTNDEVVVISGNDGPGGGQAGKRGRVLRVLPDKQKVVVEGVKIVTKHVRRPRTGRTPVGQQEGRIQMPAPIHRSKVMLVCPRCGRPTRVRMRLTESNTRVRACRKCGQDIDEG
jgi:large subunit ribosomal protein L24